MNVNFNLTSEELLCKFYVMLISFNHDSHIGFKSNQIPAIAGQDETLFSFNMSYDRIEHKKENINKIWFGKLKEVNVKTLFLHSEKRMHFYIKKGKKNILSDWSVEIFVCCRKVVMLGDRHYNKDESETGPACARARIGESRITHFAIYSCLFIYICLLFLIVSAYQIIYRLLLC